MRKTSDFQARTLKSIAMKKCFTLLSLFIAAFAAQAQNTYNEISLPQLMKKYQQNASNMVIVDVRSDGERFDSARRYQAGNIGHIKGVVHIDVQELNSNPESIKQLDAYKDKEVYLICSHSYRSRNASNILTKNGFKNVNNVQGGMTEWYRRYEDLLPYRSSLETSVKYTNISSAQLYEMLSGNNDFLLIGVNINPVTWFDSATNKYLQYFPTFKKALFFNDRDSAKILELARKSAGKPIVLFSNYGMGGAEMAPYLVSEGITNVQFVVGGVNYFLEYLSNKNQLSRAKNLLIAKNAISFITPTYYCSQTGAVIVDIRHDTLFNKPTHGMKNDFTHLKNAVNFPFFKTAAEFEKAYPDKKATYILVSRNGQEGIDLAEQLSKNGYTIQWMLGGIGRFDWYSTNTEGLSCAGELIRP
jgi:rhodanese-related sulfurtransferase